MGRTKYNANFKCNVITYAKLNGNRSAARNFGINESCVREWRKHEAVLTNMPKNKCALRTGIVKWPLLEECTLKWILTNRQNGVSVSRNDIRLFALKWAKKNKQDSRYFIASNSWCSRFMVRNNMVLRDNRKKNLGNKLVAKNENEENLYAVVFSCLTESESQAMVTLPEDSLAASVHEKGWTEEPWTKLWIENVWKNRPDELKKPENLLVWNMFKSYLFDKTKEFLKNDETDTSVTPIGFTSPTQPFDVCINKPFIENFIEQWNASMLEEKSIY